MAKRGGRAAKEVTRAVAKEEQNFIWKACEGIFRPVKTDAFKDAEEAAASKGRKLADPRAGEPTHRTPDRVTRPKQRELADELGYKPYQPRGGAPKEPIFHNPNGEPPYISYDHTTHGAADRSGQQLPPNVPWKGASDPKTLMNRGRDGTYVPKYDANGKVYFDRVRN